jgi:hypothetical protein
MLGSAKARHVSYSRARANAFTRDPASLPPPSSCHPVRTHDGATAAGKETNATGTVTPDEADAGIVALAVRRGVVETDALVRSHPLPLRTALNNSM